MRAHIGHRHRTRGQQDIVARAVDRRELEGALSGHAGGQAPVQAENLAETGCAGGCQLHHDIEVMHPRDVRDERIRHQGGNAGIPQMQAAGIAATGQNHGLAVILDPQLAVIAQLQKVGVLDANHANGGIGGAVGQADGQFHVIIPAGVEIMGDLFAPCRGAIAEIPVEDRVVWQLAPIVQAEAGVEDPRLHRARGVDGGFKQRGHGSGLGQVSARPRGASPGKVYQPARRRQKHVDPVLGRQRGRDEQVAVEIRLVRVLVLHIEVIADIPAALIAEPGHTARQVVPYGDILRQGRHVDMRDFDGRVLIIGGGPVSMQHRVVVNVQVDGFTDRDAMKMAVHHDIVRDGDIAVIHAGPGAGQFVAHEDRLRPVSVARIQQVVLDHDIGRGRRGSGGPELDHVGMIQRGRGGAKIVEMVVVDDKAVDLHEIHAIGPDIVHVIAGNRY